MYYVYKITNLLNGMIYVGVHKGTNPNDSYMGSGLRIKRAIEKDGVENFRKDILFEFQTETEAYAKEAEIVNEEFLARDDVYNLTLGGTGGFYHIDTRGDNNPMKRADVAARVADGVKKTRSKNKGFYDSISRRNISKYNNDNTVDKSHTKETRDKISSRLKEHYAENGHNRTGTTLSEETRSKISSAWSEDKKELQRQRMLARIEENPDCVKTNLGKKMSDETKEKMRDAAKKRWESKRHVITTCPHCGKSGVEQALKRWHFDNCRSKEKS